MKKKVVLYWGFFLVIIVSILLPLVFLIVEICNYSEHSISRIFGLVLIIILSFAALNELYSYTLLTENQIIFKYKLIGKRNSFPVSKVNKFVVDVNCVDDRRAVYLIIYANTQNGQILGIGNAALMALMKYYPHIPVVLKDIDWRMMRGTARYIVKHQKTSKFKCKQLCEYYHLPKKLLECAGNNINDKNDNIE